jgi:phosphatidylethanolamine/phosphatidyl-N-methylethanolamine N-methyltransferase
MITFVSQAVRNFQLVGAVWPSSPMLAKALVKPLSRSRGGMARRPIKVLEVGAGTGAVTKALLASLGSTDSADVVELNPVFCETLERLAARRIAQVPGLSVRIHAKPIEEADLAGPYDFVICGLPFNNFPPTLMRRIFRRMLSLLADGGTLTYFEYAGVRVARSGVSSAHTRRRLRRIEAVGKLLHRRLSGRRELILGNFPPAIAIRLERKGQLPAKFVDASLSTVPRPSSRGRN